MKTGHIKTKILTFGIAGTLGLAGLGASAVSAASSATGTTKVNVKVGSVIAMTVPSEIAINIDAPATTGTFSKASGTVTVTTNSRTGYNVYLTSNDANTALNPTAAGVTTKFSAGAGTGGALTNTNTWGWSSDGQTFKPVQAAGTANGASTLFAGSDVAKTGSENHTLTIGANADSKMVSGTYSGTILLTAITNE